VTDADLQGKLAEYEGIIQMLTAKVEELVAANERLTSELTAHQTLKAIYADPNQPATVRVRAAQAALNVESPKLQSVPPPLDLVAEKIEPLAELVNKRRARQDLLEPPHRVLSDGHTVVLFKGNGRNDGDDSSD
jgi:hypothetical protein